MAYLRGHFEPADEKDGKRMFQRARSYTIFEGELYKLGVVEPWLKCIPISKGRELLQENHSGLCGSHIEVRPLVSKAFRQGFFWPLALKDEEQIVKTHEGCQMMGLKSNRPSGPLQLIPPAWPLQRWGMDLVGPLPTAQGNYKYAVVAVEYFTKWIEAKPLVNITSEAVQKFFWENIICRFGVPKELTIDNGKQFDSQLLKEFCNSMGTKVMFASVYHPQSNGAIERANGIIFTAIKKCLFNQKKREMGR